MSFINPIENGYLTSSFGKRKVNRYDGKGWVDDWHLGVDLSRQPNSKVPVRAAADGEVIRVQTMTGYGKIVIIKHDVGGVYYETNYAHLASQSVTKGQKVKQGQIIGIMGKTGGNWPIHLHFEIHKGPWVSKQLNAVDPSKYIKFYSKGELAKMEKRIEKLEAEFKLEKAKVAALEKVVEYKKEEAADGWASDDIKWAVENGITDGTYLKRPITRQEAVVLVVRGINHVKAFVKAFLKL